MERNSLERYKYLSENEKSDIETFLIYRDIKTIANEKDNNITDEEMRDLKDVILDYYKEDSVYCYRLEYVCYTIAHAYLAKKVSMEQLKDASYNQLSLSIQNQDFSYIDKQFETNRYI